MFTLFSFLEKEVCDSDILDEVIRRDLLPDLLNVFTDDELIQELDWRNNIAKEEEEIRELL